MHQQLWRAIIVVIAVGTTVAGIYEAFALASGNITISQFLAALAEKYHPVYMFAGIIGGFLFVIALFGTHLPLLLLSFLCGSWSWAISSGHCVLPHERYATKVVSTG